MFKKSYSYADIGMSPRKVSILDSRSKADTQISIRESVFSAPIILAPMTKVTGSLEMAIAAEKEGAFFILPRQNDFIVECAFFEKVKEAIASKIFLSNPIRFGVSIPANSTDFLKRLNFYLKEGVKFICIDVANGYSQIVARAIEKIRDTPGGEDIFIITGNVASYQGFKFLALAGANAVRVGIGGGSVCTTSIATGVGIGQATLVREIAEQRVDPTIEDPWLLNDKIDIIQDCLLIADGGIKTPGDVSKAIALGADLVMIGGMFAGTAEAPGAVIAYKGEKYKHFAGQASMYIKGQDSYVEGADTLVPYRGKFKDIWKGILEGLRSSISYMGSRNIQGFKYQSSECFYILGSAAHRERDVHA